MSGRTRVATASRTTHLFGAASLAIALLGACSDEPASTTIVTHDQVEAAERRFAPIEREGELFQELRAGDVDPTSIEAFVAEAYVPGIVFDDVSFGAYDEGTEQVADMYGTFLFYFGDAAISWRPPFVGADSAVSVITFTGVTLGSTEFGTDAPLVEVDLMTVDGDQISSNVLFYENDALVRIFGEPDLPGDPTSYVEAWNTGRVDRIVELYSAEATRLDGLEPGAEPGLVRESVERFATALDGATWAVDLAFSQAGGDRAGAVLDVTSAGCRTQLAVVWTIDDAGSITSEVVHYDPVSTLDCEWATSSPPE